MDLTTLINELQALSLELRKGVSAIEQGGATGMDFALETARLYALTDRVNDSLDSLISRAQG